MTKTEKDTCDFQILKSLNFSGLVFHSSDFSSGNIGILQDSILELKFLGFQYSSIPIFQYRIYGILQDSNILVFQHFLWNGYWIFSLYFRGIFQDSITPIFQYRCINCKYPPFLIPPFLRPDFRK